LQRTIEKHVKILLHVGHSRPCKVLNHYRHSFLLLCYSNFFRKLRRLSDIQLQKCRDLEFRVRGHLRSWKWYHSIDYVWLPITVQ